MHIRTHHTVNSFTLVELLVVVMIISLLTLLAFTGLGRAKDFSERSKCSSNLRQIGVAIFNYAQDNDGSFPPLYYPDHWGLALWPYLGMTTPTPLNSKTMPEPPKVFLCPSDTLKTVHLNGASRPWTYNSYGLNHFYIQGGVGGTLQPSKLKIGNIQSASSTVLATDAADNSTPSSWYFWVNPVIGGAVARIGARHNDLTGVNTLWFDGHVSMESRDYLLNTNLWGSW